jgi:uncharacterized protein (DUF885 family)
MVAARELVDGYWSDFLATEPLFATQVGDHRFDHVLAVPDEEGRARKRSVHDGLLRAARGIVRGALDREDRIALALAEAVARRELAFLEHELDLLWAVSHMLAGHRQGPGVLLAEIAAVQPSGSREEHERYLERLAAVDDLLDAECGNARRGRRSGITAARVVVRRLCQQVDRVLATPIDESVALRPLASADGELRDRARRLLADEIYPAYARLRDELTDYLPRAREELGLCGLAGGGAIYRSEILAWTTVCADPLELHRQGWELLEEVRAEQRAVVARLGHSSPHEALAARPRDNGAHMHSREEILAFTRARVDEAWEALPEWFGHLPSANCDVEPVDPGHEDDGFDYYKLGDGTRPGAFFVNSKPPRSTHEIAATVFHESNPGHHLQTALDVEAEGRAAIRRFAAELQGSAYCEGWALYSERLADTMGLYRDDYERLGMLELQALRTARLVADTGLHELAWERDRALELLATTGLKAEWCASEVDRYSALPGQALSYRVGQLEVERMRDDWLKAGGDVVAFHDAFLRIGSVPLELAAEELASA